MLGFRPKTDEVLSHWIAFAENFALTPKEFYAAVEQAIAANKIPGLEISGINYREGGLLSDQRIYLRMIRERLAFDICAAPFGSYFFFSCRSVYSPAVIRLWQILVLALFFSSIYYMLYQSLGTVMALIAVAGIFIAIAWTMRNTIALGLSDLDTLLLKSPAIGSIYERWIRSSDTYYREDTRLLYLEVVPNVVKKIMEEFTSAKGVKLVHQYERAPILGELYKRSISATSPDKSK